MDRLKYLRKVLSQLGEKAQGSKFVQALEKEIPMDAESRLARGKELFPMEGFHATPVRAGKEFNLDTGEILPDRVDFQTIKPGIDDLVHLGTPEQAEARLAGLQSPAGTPGTRTYKLKFRAKKPLKIKDPGSFDAWVIAPELEKQGIISKDQAALIKKLSDDPTVDPLEANKQLKNILSEKGYDSFVYKNTGELPLPAQKRYNELMHKADSNLWRKEMLANSDDPERGLLLNSIEEEQAQLQKEIEDLVEKEAKDSYALFDSSQVRSPTAVFDPKAVNEKTLLAGGAGAAIGLAASDDAEAQILPKTQPRMTLIKKQLQSQYGKDVKDLNKSKYKDFLEKIAKIESSDRYQVEHPVINTGLHKDAQAIGRYGLMPKTVRQIAYNLKNKQSDLAKIMGPGYSDPEVSDLLNKDEAEYKGILETNPNLQDKIANYLATDLSYKHNDDIDKMAYGWNQGSQIRSKDITPEKLEQSEYIKKLRKLNNPVIPNVKVLKDE